MRRKLVAAWFVLLLFVLAAFAGAPKRSVTPPTFLVNYPDLIVQEVTYRELESDEEGVRRVLDVLIKNIGAGPSASETAVQVLIPLFSETDEDNQLSDPQYNVTYPLWTVGALVLPSLAAGGTAAVRFENQMCPAYCPRFPIEPGYVVVIVDWPNVDFPLGRISEGPEVTSTGESNNVFGFLFDPTLGTTQTFENPSLGQ